MKHTDRPRCLPYVMKQMLCNESFEEFGVTNRMMLDDRGNLS